mmetsp:Transcript_33252/g.100461  ORF Transcript_33252/g.100461 Transcript_33252/m.100461 type:complete len:279 (-) Transcript_33252:1016-1852(-)
MYSAVSSPIHLPKHDLPGRKLLEPSECGGVFGNHEVPLEANPSGSNLPIAEEVEKTEGHCDNNNGVFPAPSPLPALPGHPQSHHREHTTERRLQPLELPARSVVDGLYCSLGFDRPHKVVIIAKTTYLRALQLHKDAEARPPGFAVGVAVGVAAYTWVTMLARTAHIPFRFALAVILAGKACVHHVAWAAAADGGGRRRQCLSCGVSNKVRGHSGRTTPLSRQLFALVSEDILNRFVDAHWACRSVDANLSQRDIAEALEAALRPRTGTRECRKRQRR